MKYKGYDINRDLLNCRFTVFCGLKELKSFKTMKEAIEFIEKMEEDKNA